MGDRDTCYSCGEHGHFARDCPQGGSSGRGRGGRRGGGFSGGYGGYGGYGSGGGGYSDWLAGGGGSLCLKCFQVSRPRPFKRRCSWEGYGCYSCGEPGHIARNCTGMRNSNNGNSGSGGRSCYNCGEEGHISRDCPQGGSKDRVQCYRCRGFGHLSRDCTQGGDGPMCYKCKGFGHIANQCPA